MYLKLEAWAHSFNEKIGVEKYAPGPEILAKRAENQVAKLNLHIFSDILAGP